MEQHKKKRLTTGDKKEIHHSQRICYMNNLKLYKVKKDDLNDICATKVYFQLKSPFSKEYATIYRYTKTK